MTLEKATQKASGSLFFSFSITKEEAAAATAARPAILTIDEVSTLNENHQPLETPRSRDPIFLY